MAAKLLDLHVLGALTRDGRLLFVTRFVRLFGYGLLAVVLVLYLNELGFSETQSGLLLTLTLAGDTAVSLWITTTADRKGRRKMLIAGAGLMLLAGAVFAISGNFFLLLIAATVGVISPNGAEVGPFLAIEQAALSQLTPGESRTGTLAWYSLTGSVATAVGSLAAGFGAYFLQRHGLTVLASYRVLVVVYAALGVVLAGLFGRLSPGVEVAKEKAKDGPAMFLGLHRSRGVVLKLAALFSLDAFAGGFVFQALAAYWFKVRFNADTALIGSIFFGANILAGFSALTASRLAQRFGLINTMVWTHVPSNVLLILVPLMPNLPLAIMMLLLRFSISQMDVPARQSYTMAMVDPDERSAAAGVTGVARTTGAAISPLLAGVCLSVPALLSMPFFLSGGLKIIYDVLLYRMFRHLREPEEGNR